MDHLQRATLCLTATSTLLWMTGPLAMGSRVIAVEPDAGIAGATAQPIRQAPVALLPANSNVNRLVSSLSASNLQGSTITPKWADSKATLVIMTSATCPISRKFSPAIASLAKAYEAKGVSTLLVNVEPTDSAAAMGEHARSFTAISGYLVDHDRMIAAALGATSTTEAFLIDRAGTLVFRGAISDQYGIGYSLDAPRHRYVTDALDAVLAGTRPRTSMTTAPGCTLDLAPAPAAGENAAPTYHARISRIVQANCVSCHHAGGIGPFSLESYEDVASRSGIIRSVVSRGVMPPWFAAPMPAVANTTASHQSPWANDRTLAPEDKNDLLAWISAGKPKGDPASAPVTLTWAGDAAKAGGRDAGINGGWTIGLPDAVFRLPAPVPIKAEGTMPYANIRVATNFTEDKWVRAVQVLPGNTRAVHHVLVFVLPKPLSGENREGIEGTRGFFAAYVPGSEGTVWPDAAEGSPGMAKKIPAGASLLFQIHYTPYGAVTTDQTQIGLRFASAPPSQIVRTSGIANTRLKIPPNTAAHPEHASIRLPADVQLRAFMPHMHVRGSGFSYTATLPDGTQRLLLDVPHYDFNWQLRYELREPMTLPKGTVIRATAVYDNSTDNPFNPDPTKTVRWGQQTYEEMMLGYIEYTLANETQAAELDLPEHDGGEPAAKEEKDPAAVKGEKGRKAFDLLDTNKDGKLDRDEVPQRLRRRFDRLDTNTDGVLTFEEFEKSQGK